MEGGGEGGREAGRQASRSEEGGREGGWGRRESLRGGRGEGGREGRGRERGRGARWFPDLLEGSHRHPIHLPKTDGVPTDFGTASQSRAQFVMSQTLSMLQTQKRPKFIPCGPSSPLTFLAAPSAPLSTLPVPLASSRAF
jgi:hypothetical protein